MEQHAVPQDITGFKFKLVGDMTLKQFGELAFGAVMAYLFYASNWHPLLKWPLVIGFALFGIALAFLPIEERPLDIWIINFFRAIYRPTYYLWEKGAATISFMQPPPTVTKQPTTPTAPVAPPTVPAREVPGLAPWPFPKGKEAEKKEAPPPVAATATVQPGLSIEDLQKMREKKLAEMKEPTKPQPVPEETSKVAESLVTVDELEKMRQEALSKKLTGAETKLPKSTPLTSEAGKAATATVRFLAAAGSKAGGITLTDKPNVVNGMVVDSRGAPMDGVILVVKDAQGNAIRALKTNKIGQFIVSTPLPNGKYSLELERQGYLFDVLEMTLSGQILPPVEVVARKAEQTI